MRYCTIILILFLTSCASGIGYGGSSYKPKTYTSSQDLYEDLIAEMNYNDKQKKLISFGRNFLGSRYTFGGSSPSEGFDCSGFTQYIYSKSLAVALPRTTKAQSRVGRPISWDRLEPGDLVFFDLSGRLSHVGVYLGNGKFFHASTSEKKLIIADMRKKYFANRFNSARRVLK